MLKPHFTLDRTHLLVGMRKNGWKGLNLQWEFGAYINLDLAWNDAHDYRWTYNYPSWRNDSIHAAMTRDFHAEPLPRFQFTR